MTALLVVAVASILLHVASLVLVIYLLRQVAKVGDAVSEQIDSLRQAAIDLIGMSQR